MAVRRFAGAIGALSLAVACLGAVQLTAQAGRVKYESFCGLPFETKLKIFNDISPENRADLVRAQIQRWLNKNRARLTSEQVKVLEENLAFIKADLYRLPRREADMAKAKDLEQRTLAVMSREDAAQALTIHGACVEKD